MLGRHTPPTPLWDGEILEAAFFLVMRGLWRGDISPLERGLRGVLRGEARVGLRCSRYSFERFSTAGCYPSGFGWLLWV